MIQLTGLGSESFKTTIRAIEVLDNIVSRQLPPESLFPWSPSTFDVYSSIDIGNRYYSLRSHTQAQDIIDFPPEVDPQGSLQRSGRGQFVHALENQVSYFRRVGSGDDASYVFCCPSGAFGELTDQQLRTCKSNAVPSGRHCGDSTLLRHPFTEGPSLQDDPHPPSNCLAQR